MVSAPASGKPDWNWEFLLLSRWCWLTRLTSARFPVPHWGTDSHNKRRQAKNPTSRCSATLRGWRSVGSSRCSASCGPCRHLLHEFRDGKRSMQGVPPETHSTTSLSYGAYCSRKCHLRRLRRGHHRSESAGHPETIRPGLPAESDVYCEGLMRVPTTVRGTASTSR